MSYRWIAKVALSATMIFGCGGDDDAPAPAASGGAGGEGGAGCSTDGTATIEVEVSGLPDGLAGDVVLNGDGVRETFTETTTFEDLATGDYSLSAGTVLDDDPVVRTVYEPVIDERDFCLEDGATHVVSVSYEALPSSNKLWTSSLVGFPSAELRASGEATPIVVEAPAGKDLAFDRSGNLWVFGGTLAEPHVLRFAVGELGSGGEKEWDLGLNVPAVACIPAMRAIAFAGPDLWLSVCGEQVMKFTNGMFLEDSGDTEPDDITPDQVISGMSGNQDIAANEAGLWVATGTTVLRYNSRPDAEYSGPADLTLTIRDAEDSRDLDPTGLTFDADGNLWGFGFGSNSVFKIAAADLDQEDEQVVIAEVSFVLGVEVLVATGAFDDGGGLWVSHGSGRIGRLSPAQLAVSAGTGDPVTPERMIQSDALDSELNIALFAAPAGVPLAPGYD